MERNTKRNREAMGVGDGKKKKVYGGVMWRAVKG